ncbi:lectin-like domain-containing protein [Leuconostoc gasicomitatum]|uniref:MucBP domain-containing protein n=1 Tax=Leuconostoc gasicomitatum TaxID=115778 RepID=A0A9Q3SZE3_9LACO|nr:MucBP domain-containing protein [Leuconostoc gasicomitatum]MBZ5962988.1 MucBP domain-containing protein [Leuconostoc gasicomitatum]
MKNKQVRIRPLFYMATVSVMLLSFSSITSNYKVSAKTITLSQLLNQNSLASQLILNGSSSVNDNLITLTSDNTEQSGTAYIKTPINFSNDVSLNLSVNIGNKSQQHDGGDGMAVSFVPADQIKKVNQKNGGSLGLGGISHIFGFKIDTYFNRFPEEGSFKADPPQFGHRQGDGQSFGAFFDSKNEGVIHTITDEAQQIDEKFNNQFKSLIVSYNSQSSSFTVTYDNQVWHYKNMQKFQSPMYLVFSAATGRNHNVQQIMIDDTNYKPFTSSVTVNYLDNRKNNLLPSTKFTGNIGETYKINEEKIPGYILSNQSQNSSGIFNETDSEINFYYQPMQHHVIVNFRYNDRILRKEVFSGNTGETINYATMPVLEVLKKYQVTRNEWPGTFTIPRTDQQNFYFNIELSKKNEQIDTNEASNKTSNKTPNQAMDQHNENKESQDQTVVLPEKENIIPEIVAANDDQNDSPRKQQLTFYKFELNNSVNIISHPKKDKSMYMTTLDQGMAIEKKLSRQAQPSPFNYKISSFTKVLAVLATTTTFSDR